MFAKFCNNTLQRQYFAAHHHLIYPLTARVLRAPRMISQPVSSIFPCSPLPSRMANSRPVHSLMLSSHLFLCQPCIFPSFTVPRKMVLARPDERETWPYHCSLRLFTMVGRSCVVRLPAGSWHGLSFCSYKSRIVVSTTIDVPASSTVRYLGLGPFCWESFRLEFSASWN